MADNETTGTGKAIATRKGTYSGDASQNVQVVGLVGFSGADDAKTIADIADTVALFVQGPAAHDAGIAGNPLLMGGRASAAAPTSVDADGDAVRAWYLRNGAQATVLTAAGALISGDASNGLDVDITRIGEGIADDAGFTVGTSRVIPAGLQAVAHGSAPDTADALDAVVAIANRHRVPFVIGGHPNVVTLKHTTITTAVTDAAIVASISSGTKVVVTRLTVTLDNASTVFPTVLIGFGVTNTPTTTGVIYSHGGFPAGGGQNVGDGSGIIGVGGDGEELRVTTTGNATGNGLQITVSYYLIDS